MRSKFEIKAQKELEAEHFFVDFKIRPTHVYKNAPVDYFHLADLLAVREGEFRFISIKGKSCPAQHKKDLQRFAEIVPSCVSVELWQYDKQLKDKRKIRRRITKYEG